MNLEQQAARTIARYNMLSPGQPVLAALSGGADSVALVCVLRALGYPLRAYHLNHCLRGAESERDADFVRALCARLDIPLTLEREDAAAYAAGRHESIETAARALRYARLNRCAAQYGIARIATAHTADDNLETMLFHLARGTGTRGFAGIPPVRGAVIRPLWTATRAEIEQYLAESGQDFVVDSSNLSADYTRNRIRQRVVPVLRDINPGCAGAASRLAARLREDDETLCLLAEQALGQADMAAGVPLEAFRQPPAIQGRMLSTLLRRAGVPMHAVTARHMEQLTDLLAAGRARSMSLPGSFCASHEAGRLRILFEPERPPVPLFDGFHGRLWDTSTILTVKTKKSGQVFHKTCDTFLADCGTIHFGTLAVRPPQPGDRLTLPGARGARQLKRLMADRGLPPSARARLAVVADAAGIVLAQGVGVEISRVPRGGEIVEFRFEGL